MTFEKVGLVSPTRGSGAFGAGGGGDKGGGGPETQWVCEVDPGLRVIKFPLHGVHDVALAPEAYVPIGHSTHLAYPLVLFVYVPGEHDKHGF